MAKTEKTIRQLWEETTKVPWHYAKMHGFTDGTLGKNLELRQKLLTEGDIYRGGEGSGASSATSQSNVSLNNEQAQSEQNSILGNLDNLTFGQAFAQSRKAGEKEFTWKGNRYNTKTKEEVEAEQKKAQTTTKPVQQLNNQNISINKTIPTNKNISFENSPEINYSLPNVAKQDVIQQTPYEAKEIDENNNMPLNIVKKFDDAYRVYNTNVKEPISKEEFIKIVEQRAALTDSSFDETLDRFLQQNRLKFNYGQ